MRTKKKKTKNAKNTTEKNPQRFDPGTQRLKLIDVYDVRKCLLAYSGTQLSGKGTEPTCALVYRTFGPTYPGTVDRKRNVYFLQYPGVCFMFPIPTDCRKNKGTLLYATIPLQTTDTNDTIRWGPRDTIRVKKWN